MSPFDIINNISTSSVSAWDDIGDKDYNSFMVNRGLSYYNDCLFQANEMNRYYTLPKEMQYQFLLHAIGPKKKRFSKWASSKKDKEIQLVSEYFSVTLRKAAAIRNLLSDGEMKEVEAKLSKGGNT